MPGDRGAHLLTAWWASEVGETRVSAAAWTSRKRRWAESKALTAESMASSDMLSSLTRSSSQRARPRAEAKSARRSCELGLKCLAASQARTSAGSMSP